MRLILCEKPSVAQDFAKALGGIKKDGYFEAKGYIITWAYGHLFEIDDSIAPQKWSLEDLPIFPEKFSYKLRQGSGKQFKVIKELLKKVKEVIIATDAGREGELIARLILWQAGWKGKTYRFWTSSALTPDVIRRELNNLKPSEEFDSLYYCALARQHADWLVGINLTRGVSLRSSGGIWSVGRVQTPTLALIVRRDEEIENFKPQPYWIVKAIFEKGGIKYEATFVSEKSQDKRDRYDEGDDYDEGEEDQEEGDRLTEESAKKIVKAVEKAGFGTIEKVIKRREEIYPPRLFSLSSLQREANKLFGWSANKTLSVAQRLYEEHKVISYPRTDAEYLSEENIPLVKEVLRALGREDLIPSVEKVGKRVFDRTKLTDHHAIIPLKPFEGSGEDKLLYDVILKRFLSVFYPPQVIERTQVWTRSGGYLFYASGIRVLSQGWKELYSETKDRLLPYLKEGDKVRVEKVFSLKRFTKPPPRYTEGKLIKVMEKLSLGTPATRASIIETLKQRKYVVLNKKHLISTEKARELIRKLQGSKVIQVELTSEWEKELESIYTKKKGYKGYQEFLTKTKQFVEEEVRKIKKMSFEGGTKDASSGGKGSKDGTKAYSKAYKKGKGGGTGKFQGRFKKAYRKKG